MNLFHRRQEIANTPHVNAQPLRMSAGSVYVQWVPAHAIKSKLAEAYHTWPDIRTDLSNQELATIRHEVWLADRAFQVMPMVAVAESVEGIPLGVLAGFPKPHHNCFFICEIALYPFETDESDRFPAVATSLLEAAMDESQQMGCHGWVACEPTVDRISFWRQLGFTRYDDFTFRRMGYF